MDKYRTCIFWNKEKTTLYNYYLGMLHLRWMSYISLNTSSSFFWLVYYRCYSTISLSVQYCVKTPFHVGLTKRKYFL